MSSTVQWPEFVDTGAATEHDRMGLLERLFDPFSRANLDRIGVRPGWKCLDVGAGGGSVARELAERAGAENVVATDVSTVLLGPLAESGVTVLHHDVLVDDAPGEFDLIHSRFVLDHLPRREEALRRMVSWLKPGGILLLEGGSTAPEMSSRPEVGAAMAAGNQVLATGLGTAPRWSRSFPLPLIEAGLLDCSAQGQAIPVHGGGPMARWLRDTFAMTEDRALTQGLITQADLDTAHAAYDDPTFIDYTWLTIAATGRRA